MNSTFTCINTIVWIAFFAALIAVSAFISFPLGPIPFTLQSLSISLTGLCIGGKRAALCVILYIFAGCIGLPVFAGGKAGPGVLLSPTGGYLIGFIGLAYLTGFGSGHNKNYPPKKAITILFMSLGLVVTYFCGATGLMWVLSFSPTKAILTGVLPFLPGDILKLVIAFAIWKYLLKKGLLPNDPA